MTEIPDEQPTAADPPTGETSSPTPPPPPIAQPPAYAQPPMPYPFMPVARPPRAPWVNPAKRLQVGAVALALALVCGAAGIAIGWAASDGHGDRGMRIERPGFYGGYLLPGPGGPNGKVRPFPVRPPASPSTSG